MQRYTNIPEGYLQYDLKSFLDNYLHEDPAGLSLRFRERVPFDRSLLFTQLKLHHKALRKLPVFAENYCFFTPTAYEQSSSEALAKYKAGLVSGSRMLDLCGGLGVDDWAFSAVFNEVLSLDTDSGLNRLVRRNNELLGLDHVTRTDADAAEFLAGNSGSFDLVYMDADRRAGSGKKAVTLYEGEPDVLALWPLISRCTSRLMLKLSPLVDLSHIIRVLPLVSEIRVISQHNEVKEVLVLSDLSREKGEVKITAADLDEEGNVLFTFSDLFKEQAAVSEYADEGTYFYEPGLALIKSGLAADYARTMQLSRVGPNSAYYVSAEPVEPFFGRTFRIMNRVTFQKKEVEAYLRNNGITKANVARRNFRLDVQEIRRKFNLKDGGEDYLFFTTTQQSGAVMYHCRKT